MHHLGSPQIQVAILEPQLFIDLGSSLRIIHGKRKDIGGVEHLQFLHHDFHFSGGDLGILCSLRATTHFSGDRDHTFAMQGCRLIEHITGYI